MPKNIVLIHGWGASAQKLSPLSNELQKFGWKTLVLELPGFDLPMPKTIWGTEEYAKYILEQSKKRFRSQKFVIFGHSFGGRIAIDIATDEKHLPDRVEGIVLCAASGLSRDSILKRLPMKIIAKSTQLGRKIPVAGKLFEYIYERGQRRYYKNTPGIMKQIFQKIAEDNFKPLIKNITLPTLILWGSKDTMTPVKDAYFLKSEIKNSKLKVYPGIGHKLPYDHSRELAKEIDVWVKIN